MPAAAAACPSNRPSAYHRRRHRKPWLLALRRLWSHGYCDQRIAEMLTDLSADTIQWLEQHNQWSRGEIEEQLQPHASGLSWSRRQVWYYRSQVLDLPRCCPREHRSHANDCTRAVYLGWGHLAPLTRGELRLVHDLHTNGPGTLADLEQRTGLALTRRRAGRRTPLRRLLDRAIATMSRIAGRAAPVYALAAGIVRRSMHAFSHAAEAFVSGMRVG